MQVSEILSSKGSEIYSVSPDAMVYEAIRLMSEKNVGALLVMKGDELKGIISERDYRNKVILKGRTSKETPVHDIMTPKVVCVPAEATIEGCMSIMTEHKIRHLPIIDEGSKVIGILSIGDLVKAVISKQKQEIDTLQRYITGEYPG